MLAKKPFEIRVALVGPASSGKSTIVNALFGDKYADTSLKLNASAAVHCFRLVSSSSTSAADIVDEIGNSNNSSYINDDDKEKVQEQWFDVELEEELCAMRKDTQLVFVDIPGIHHETDNSNAGSDSNKYSNKYKQYIQDKWSSFDCVILVLDGKQSVQDQTFLLKLAKQHLQEQKDVPIVVLFNKVDDPDDEQQAELVQEARATVEDIFQVDDASTSSSPLFIPISALYAFLHHTASRMSLEAFERFLERDWMEKLGRDQVGKRKWNRLSDEEKVQEIYDIVSSKQEVLTESNFETFLSTLNRFVGGEDVQRTLIEKQFQVSLWALQDPDFNWNNNNNINNQHHHGSISEQFHKVFKEAQVLYGTEAPKNLPMRLTSEFWKIYQRYEESCLEQFTKLGPLHVYILAGPIAELLSFHRLSEQIVPEQIGVDCLESANILIRMKSLVRQMISILLDQHDKYDGKTWMSTRKENDGSSPSPWKNLSPLDWTRIWNSLLLLSYDRHFCEVFGNEKAIMEEHLYAAQKLWRRFKSPESSSKLCPYCGEIVTSTPIGIGGDEQCASCKTLFLAPVTPMCFFCRASGIADDGLCKSTTSQNENCRVWHQVPKIDFFNATKLSYDCKTGRLQPLSPDHYCKVVRIEIPESFSNPMHLGHAPFSVCEFLKTVKLTNIGVFRHVFSTILELEPDSRILKALHHGGYTSMDHVYAMDESTRTNLEYEGFDDKVKRKLEGSDTELLSHLLDWVDYLKTKAPNNTIAPMDWIALTAEDFRQYRSTRSSKNGVSVAPPGHSLHLQTAPSPQATASCTKPASSVSFCTPKASLSTSNDATHPYPTRSPRQMLTTFYRHYNPSKMADIDSLLFKYRGNEEALFRKLAQKYQVDESMFGLSKSEGTGSPSPVGFSSPSPFSASSPSSFGASTMSSASPFGQHNTTSGSPFGNPASSTPKATNVNGSSATLAPSISFGTSPQLANKFYPKTPFSFSWATTGSSMASPSIGNLSPFTSTPTTSVSTVPNAFGAALSSFSQPFWDPMTTSQGSQSNLSSPFVLGTPPVSTSFGSRNPTASNGTTQPPNPLGLTGSAMTGTRTVPFIPTNATDGTEAVTLNSISAMDAYQNKSFEELRCEDYLIRYGCLSP